MHRCAPAQRRAIRSLPTTSKASPRGRYWGCSCERSHVGAQGYTILLCFPALGRVRHLAMSGRLRLLEARDVRVEEACGENGKALRFELVSHDHERRARSLMTAHWVRNHSHWGAFLAK